ncbi:MAG: protein-glutamate O-methyltransferase CheR [Chitinophagaceae bacterium]|nr:MAG: protein-glutamate O-methyltransferase CheR [Chitinophagaceae bacterium]
MIKDAELDILLNDLLECYGYDFTEYARASLKRRVQRLYTLDRFPSFAEFRYRLRSEPGYFRRFVEEITVNVTEMFRDPAFYEALRSTVINVLATYPLIRIWHAGCATGEEVYSMAILLKEAGLLHKSLLYATDLNPDALEYARKGIYPLAQMKMHSENYVLSGGRADFSSYYTARYDHAQFNRELTSKMIFATHNLVHDRSFNEFQLILCRNVMIYFDKPLQDRVLQLFDSSLEPLGFLCLGSKENLRFSAVAQHFTQWSKEKIWRKTG